MQKISGPGATVDNEFTDGNPLTGTPATVVQAAWLNTIQRELIAVLGEAGITPSALDDTQLLQAIQSLIAGGGSAVTADAVSIDDAGSFFPAGTLNVEAALQFLAETLASGTTAASRIRRSVVALSGAAHNLASGHFENIIEVDHSSAATYTILPDGTLSSPIGTSITLFQAGAGQVEAVAGSGVTLRKPASFLAKTLEQHAAIVVVKTAANTWRVGGTMEAA